NYNELLKYLCSKNVIRKKVKCPRCQNILQLKDGELFFQCAKHYYKKIQKRKYKRVTCNFKISALYGTWFSHGHLSMDVICRLICYVIMSNAPRQLFLQRELSISS
ncbi:hypothetical protein EAI_15966, partial [Harpegnathos saltator]